MLPKGGQSNLALSKLPGTNVAKKTPASLSASEQCKGGFRVKRVAEINDNLPDVKVGASKRAEKFTEEVNITASTSKRRRTHSSESDLEFIVINSTGPDSDGDDESNADEAVTMAFYLQDEPLDIKSEVEYETEKARPQPGPPSSHTNGVANAIEATAVIKEEEEEPDVISTSHEVPKVETQSSSLKTMPKGYVKQVKVRRRQQIHTIPKEDTNVNYVPLPFEFYVGESFALSSSSSMAAAQKRMLAKIQGGNYTENATKDAEHSTAQSTMQHKSTAQSTVQRKSTAQSTVQRKSIVQGTVHPCTMCNCGVMQEVLERLSDIEAAVNKLDRKVDTLSKEVISKKEFALQNKIIRDNLLITKRLGLTTQRVFGHTKTDIDIEVASMLPLNTIGDVRDLENKLEQDEYMCALKLHLFALKGPNGTVDVLFRKIIGDQCVANFNWDGRYRRMALQATKIFSNAFIDTFPEMTRMEVEKSIRKSVERAHNRLKQFNFKYRKATILNAEA